MLAVAAVDAMVGWTVVVVSAGLEDAEAFAVELEERLDVVVEHDVVSVYDGSSVVVPAVDQEDRLDEVAVTVTVDQEDHIF